MIDAVENKRREFLSVRCNWPTQCNTCYRLKVWNLRKSLNCFLLHTSWRFVVSWQPAFSLLLDINPGFNLIPRNSLLPFPWNPCMKRAGRGREEVGSWERGYVGFKRKHQTNLVPRVFHPRSLPLGWGRWKTLGTRLAPNVRKKMRRMKFESDVRDIKAIQILQKKIR